MKIKKIILKVLILTIAILFLIQNSMCVRATSSELIDSTMRVASIESKMKTNALVMGGCIIGLIAIVIVGISNSGKKKDNKGSNVDNSDVKKLKREATDYKIDSWGELIKIMIISGFSGVIGYWIGTASGDAGTWAFFGACFPWGYAVIGNIIDDWVEVYAFLASGWLWLIVFALKIFLSAVLGAVIMPIKLVLSIVHIIQAHSLSKEVNSLSKDRVETENENKVKKEEKVLVSDDTNSESPSDDEVVKKLRKLKQMKDENIISDEEYENKKKELLIKI